MAACIGVQIGTMGDRKVSLAGLESATTGSRIPQGLSVCWSDGQRQERRNPRMSAVAVRCSAVANAAVGLAHMEYGSGWGFEESGGRDQRKKSAITPQLDQLMKESVAEIVKNISEAPFLAHVFSHQDEKGQNPSSKLVIEKASSDSWPYIKRRWETGNSTPDGIILVEELQSRDEDISLDEGTSSSGTSISNQMRSSSTRVWGLLVQGRGVTCPSCYILKTCRVQCCFGFATHFCLAKVDCFGKSIDFHLNKLWLQR